MYRLSIFIASLLFVTAEIRAAETLRERLMPLIERHQGEVAVAIKHLPTGEAFEHRGNEVMPTASLIKIAVMVEAYAQAESGKIDLKDAVELKPDDKVPGSGVLTTHFTPGLKVSLRDAVRLMIAFSDNTATNLVLDQIGLPSVGQRMEELGLRETKIHAKVFKGETSIFPDRSKTYGLGSTTAMESIRLLELLHRRELVSKSACDEMLEHLFACQDKKMSPRNLPEDVKVAHKTGSVTAVRTDAALIYAPAGPIALCVLTRDNKDRRWADDDAASVLIGRIARETFYHFNDAWQESSPPANETLTLGAQGDLVESLQRTLNARLQPSPELQIDGEFGPVTKTALVRFQKDNKLSPSGIADEATWKALGPLVTEAAPIPDPELVNAEALPKQAPDELDGTPFVTCKAWAIADGRTGQFVAGEQDSEALEMASTTKIMTAWLVIALANRHPEVLTETVIFSRRADRTGGSTSGLRAGEKISVGELLYGLMLPSGNDAAVALAEHFGGRVGPEEADVKSTGRLDPLDAFVTEMNRTAERLQMTSTQYKNPHGLPAEGHATSARDLLRLGWEAMQSPLFRKYVSTRQHGCQVTGSGGYRRNVKWKNTNELLDIEGYDGIKTGTTESAGACLVSQSRRGDDSLILVTLGSTSSKSRYADSRNLYRWAWQQRMSR